MAIKSTYREVYEVAFSLGTNLNNIVFTLRILDKPTELKVKEHLEQLTTKMQSRVWFDSGLPSRECLTYLQCLFLLERFGLPPMDLAHQCVNSDFGQPYIMGHISMTKVGSVFDMEKS